jgi:hypothetical protein
LNTREKEREREREREIQRGEREEFGFYFATKNVACDYMQHFTNTTLSIVNLT